jgi:hypothetical protein
VIAKDLNHQRCKLSWPSTFIWRYRYAAEQSHFRPMSFDSPRVTASCFCHLRGIKIIAYYHIVSHLSDGGGQRRAWAQPLAKPVPGSSLAAKECARNLILGHNTKPLWFFLSQIHTLHKQCRVREQSDGENATLFRFWWLWRLIRPRARFRTATNRAIGEN